MYRVCAHYCGTTIGLEDFETLEEAEEFKKAPYVMCYYDEMGKLDEEDNDLIYPDEMFVEEVDEDEIEHPSIMIDYADCDDLPF